MKKLLAACVCAGLSFSFAGCSPETILEQFTSTGDTSVRELTSSSDTTTETETKDRIYMDELSGTLQDFSGSQLILNTDSASYVFNVSNATLECKGGMITGDEISIIYEGQLSGTDTGSVHVLKVVDEFHKKNKLKNRTAHGQVISLTSNTITIKSKKGKTATYPITGTKQYYQNGIKAGDWVYLTFKGKFPDTSNDSSASLNASHLKVLSISDLKDLEIPDPTPTPDPKLTQTPEQIENKEKQLLATVQGVNLNILRILPAGSDASFNLDMSAIPAYFKGGIAPGSHVNVTYIGDLETTSLLAGLTLEKLNAIYKSIIRRQEDKVDPIRSKFGTIEKEEVSLSDKMIEIKDFARTHRKFSFRNLLESQCSKVQVIVTFLSILELMKMGHIHVEQNGLFDDISVEVQTDPDTWKNLTEFAEDEPQNTEINM